LTQIYQINQVIQVIRVSSKDKSDLISDHWFADLTQIFRVNLSGHLICRVKFGALARNAELKARIVKLEDKQLQNEMVKNLLSVSQKIWSYILGKFQLGHSCQNYVNFLPIIMRSFLADLYLMWRNPWYWCVAKHLWENSQNFLTL
jgi:hypothetical protein